MGRLHDTAILLGAALACASSLSCAAPLPGVADGSGPTMRERVGVSWNLRWGAGADARASRQDDLAALASVGVVNVRGDFTWHRLETAPGTWSFDDLDVVVDDADAAGVHLLGILDYGNPIYPQTGADGSAPATDLTLDNPPETLFPPQDPQHFADYVTQVVDRYGARVVDWEVWNEENIGYRFWRPQASPVAYGALLDKAAAAGHAACPSCTFVLGGLSMPQPVPDIDVYPQGPAFLDEVLANDPGAAAIVDAVAFHPYQYPKDAPEVETAPFPGREQGSLHTQASHVRAVLAAHGAGTAPPLWITEEGWPTNPGVPESVDDIARVFGLDPLVVGLGKAAFGDGDFDKLLETVRGVSEAQQARDTVRAILIASADGVERVYLYTLRDFDVEPDINQEAAFGLLRVDGSEKPAARAVRTLLDVLGDARFVRDVSKDLRLDPGARALAFANDGETVIACWRFAGVDGAAAHVSVDGLGDGARVVGQDGRELARAFAGGVDVPLAGDVAYLIDPR